MQKYLECLFPNKLVIDDTLFLNYSLFFNIIDNKNEIYYLFKFKRDKCDLKIDLQENERNIKYFNYNNYKIISFFIYSEIKLKFISLNNKLIIYLPENIFLHKQIMEFLIKYLKEIYKVNNKYIGNVTNFEIKTFEYFNELKEGYKLKIVKKIYNNLIIDFI